MKFLFIIVLFSFIVFINQVSDKNIPINNNKNELSKPITKYIKYSVYPIVFAIILAIVMGINLSKITDNKISIGILIFVVFYLIFIGILNIFLIMFNLVNIETFNHSYISVFYVLLIIVLIIRYFKKNTDFKKTILYSIPVLGLLVLFVSSFFKIINNCVLIYENKYELIYHKKLLPNDLINKKYKNEDSDKLEQFKNIYKNYSLIASNKIYKIIKYISSNINGIINYIVFTLLTIFLNKNNTLFNGSIGINNNLGNNNNNNLGNNNNGMVGGDIINENKFFDNIFKSLSSKILFTNYSTANLNIGTRILSYMFLIIKFIFIGKNTNNTFSKFLTIGYINSNNNKINKFDYKKLFYNICTSLYLSYDNYFYNPIMSLLYSIFIKLIPLIILNLY